MTLELWTAVDQYITDTVVAEDDVLRAATEAGVAAGVPQISVTPGQGKLLYLLARVQGARTILEIGTLVGYSTIWLARAVGPKGRVITLEAEAPHAAVARDNLARAGLEKTVDIRVGKALDTLPAVESAAPFDLVFIDADKESNPQYFEWAMRLTKPGSLIIIDNVVREGAVIDAGTADPRVLGVRRLNVLIAAERRVSATTIQTVGSKGYDGFTIARVNDD
ncbi:MAG TPA: O-methyltransferase [Gemmatimonadaceae bacterium]|nr:O-methyltransferase [Gemmatimonadaceae bacterium]